MVAPTFERNLRPTTETVKIQEITRKYRQTTVYWRIDVLQTSLTHGQTSMIVFASQDKNKVQARVQALRQDKKRFIVSEIRPQARCSRHVYTYNPNKKG